MSERWLRVESIVFEAADRDISERSAFLDEACAGEDDLRQEVESLLRFEGGAQEFLQRSAMEAAAQLATGEIALDAARLEIDGYTIGEFLGAGGMGEVYTARDTRLERDVALKIIRRAPEDVGAMARFEEEARSASRLNHPNIVTIHAVGSQHDVSYIVMELVSGQTLRDLMAAGPPPLATTLDIAAQLAGGLAVAHDMSVVHRDLKPENVMVTSGGLLKILDFGIARRDRVIASDTPLATSTHPVLPFPASSLAGTAGYMSPEQAARGTIDHRSDQFSFGAIVYELLTGRPVSDRDSASTTSERRTSVEPALGAIVDRCLSTSPDDRYSSTRDLAIAVRRVRDNARQAVGRRLTRRQVLATAAVAGAAVAAVLWRLPLGGAARRRLVVLPFVNVSGDENTEILCDGITEVLIRQLSRSQHLTVIGQNTAVRLKGGPQDPREVGRLLDVDEVLTGSLTMRGGRALVDVELVDARTGARIWGAPLDYPDLDVLAIQNEIAAAIISRGLDIEASDATLRELNRGLTSDREAYLLLLQAVHHLRLGMETAYLEARTLLVGAVKRDGKFALAHLMLASTYSIMAIDGYVPPLEAWPESHRHVDRALEQDPHLPDARAERANELFFFKWDWAGAQREWDMALQSRRAELQGELLSPYVLQHWALGRNKDALRFAQAARSIDPLSPMLAMREADMLAAVGDVSSAVERYTAVIERVPDPTGALVGLAQVQCRRDRYEDAIDAWRRAYAEVEDESLAAILATARGDDGCRTIDRYLAKRELASLSERAASKQYVSPLDLARAHARLEDPDKAFRFLDDAFDHRAAGLVFLNVDPAWDNIRRDPRFVSAVNRVGLARTGQRG